MGKTERTKNAARNILFGIILKLYQILVPFVMRTAMIYWMGVQYLGLNSLFTSILQVLNLAELGVGSAMVFSMYKPIVENDCNTICALMKLYKIYYRFIGLAIAGVGIVLTPFIPKLIRGDVPPGISIYILYLLNLAATVLSYWLLAYKSSILQAHQREDVISKVTLVTRTIQYLLQLIVLWVFRNYYFYVIINLLAQVLTNVTIAYTANKLYPEYRAEAEIPTGMVKDINQRIRDLFTSKIGAVVVNSADTIVVSAFLGLTMLAVYQNYHFILTSVMGFITTVFSSITAGIGNSLVVETKEKNFRDLNIITFIVAWIAGFCSCCFLNLFQPFMEIWVGKELMLEFPAVICFVAYYFVYEINQLLNIYKDAAGIWHKDRFRPLITAGANFAMNLVMVQFWGIYGVLLSTVLSMLFVGMPWLFCNLFTTIFEWSQLKPYLLKILKYTAVSSVICIISLIVCNQIHLERWAALIVRLMICCILPNALFLMTYRKLPEFADSVLLADKMTRGKLGLKKLLAAIQSA